MFEAEVLQNEIIMNPILVIFLLLVGIGGAYFLMTNIGQAQIDAGGAVNPALTNYGSLAAKVLMAVLVLYAIYYIVDVFKTSAAQRKEKERPRFR